MRYIYGNAEANPFLVRELRDWRDFRCGNRTVGLVALTKKVYNLRCMGVLCEKGILPSWQAIGDTLGWSAKLVEPRTRGDNLRFERLDQSETRLTYASRDKSASGIISDVSICHQLLSSAGICINVQISSERSYVYTNRVACDLDSRPGYLCSRLNFCPDAFQLGGLTLGAILRANKDRNVTDVYDIWKPKFREKKTGPSMQLTNLRSRFMTEKSFISATVRIEWGP